MYLDISMEGKNYRLSHPVLVVKVIESAPHVNVCLYALTIEPCGVWTVLRMSISFMP